METCCVVLTFVSVNEILWCDHSNETSLAVLLHGTTCFSIMNKMKFGVFLKILIFDTLGSQRVNFRCYLPQTQKLEPHLSIPHLTLVVKGH